MGNSHSKQLGGVDEILEDLYSSGFKAVLDYPRMPKTTNMIQTSLYLFTTTVLVYFK